MRKVLLVPAIITAMLLSSCILEDQEYAVRRSEEIERADIVLTNALYTLGQENEEPIRLESDSLSYWIDSERIEAENIRFTQMNEDGSPAVRGMADRALIDSGSKIMNLSGNVFLESIDDNLSIRSQYLIFDTERDTVNSEDEVSVSFDGGIIKGCNLSADLVRLDFDIGKIISGEVEI